MIRSIAPGRFLRLRDSLHRVAAEHQRLLAAGQQCLRPSRKALAPLVFSGSGVTLHRGVGQQVETIPCPDDPVGRGHTRRRLDGEVFVQRHRLCDLPRDQQKPGIIYSEYNVGGKTPGYKDFLGEHKGAERGQQQIVFVDGLKGLRMGVKDADKDFMIFDTLNDPQESKDLASSKPELQARMKAAALSNRRASLPSKTVFDTALVPAVETKGAASPGLKWSLYEGEFPWVPDFRQLKKQAAAHGVAPSPSVKMNGPRKRGVELTGFVKVPADGEYTFYLSTDANKGSKAFVRLHGMELIDADKTYEPGAEVSSDLGDRKNPVYLKAGLHPIRIGYVGNAGPASKLVLKWEGPGLSKQEIPAFAFSHDGGAE